MVIKTQTAKEIRNAKGEWRPPYPCTYAPLLSWPIRPMAILKWMISYPGFMWPRNLALLLVSALSWRLSQPLLERCVEFRWNWIPEIWLQNMSLLWLWYGGYYLALYIFKTEGTKGKYALQWPARNNSKFLFGNQVYDNVFWTCVSGGGIWTAYEVVTLWLYANHRIPNLSWQAHPVWFIVWLIAIPFWRELHFYWVHRLIHWKPIYKHVHYLHHKNVDVNPWSGLAMHPVEQLLYFSVGCIHWIVPSHPFHYLFDVQHAALAPAESHNGFEGPILKGILPSGSYFHYLHHRYFECNYGESTLPLDKWFGTFRDGTPTGVGVKLQEEQK